jgi:tetratricopeptide (TPR) repeat protein
MNQIHIPPMDQSIKKYTPCQSSYDVPKPLRFYVILFILVFVAYGNTFRSSWHLDDYPSIVENKKIQVTDLTLQNLHRSLQHPNNETLWRPLAHLSFALNWYAGRDNVFSYHVVNVLLHFLTAWMLYLTISTLLKTPNLQAKYSATSHVISSLATVLWVINPIQTQAVTYIVQRMTILAAFFFIACIYCYLVARLTGSERQRILTFICCATCFLMGIAAKENAALLPLTIIMVEALFFQNLGNPQTRRKVLAIQSVGGFAVVILGGLFFYEGDLLSVFSGYGDRYFGPLERLMTQPRVLIFYLSLIFCPLPGRLSIDHDFILSTSLLHPWTTLPAIVLVVVIIIGALFQARQRPLLSFIILFFFLNHLLESTIIPLELVFEHRNYLPSMFLFIPFAKGTVWLLDRYREKQPLVYRGLIGLVIGAMVGFGWATYARNSLWRTEVSLWTDANRKAPLLHRPVHNLAMAKYESTGQLDKALELYQKAVQLKMHRRSHRARLYGNIANIYYRIGILDLAEVYFTKAVDFAPFIEYNRYRLAETLYRRQKWKAALAHLDVLLIKDPQNVDFLILKGNVFMGQGDALEALRIFRSAIKSNPKKPDGFIQAGTVLVALGAYDRSETLLEHALRIDPKNLTTHLRIIDVTLRQGNTRKADVLIRQMFETASIIDITACLKDLSGELLFDRYGYIQLRQTISAELKKHIAGASSRKVQP